MILQHFMMCFLTQKKYLPLHLIMYFKLMILYLKGLSHYGRFNPHTNLAPVYRPALDWWQRPSLGILFPTTVLAKCSKRITEFREKVKVQWRTMWVHMLWAQWFPVLGQWEAYLYTDDFGDDHPVAPMRTLQASRINLWPISKQLGQ